MDDKSAIEHHKYSKRLTELEKRSAAAQQRQQKKKPLKTHVGNKIRGIKIKRYVSNGERVLKLVILFSLILLFMIYIISPLSKINTLHVTGNHDLTKEQVEKNTNIYPGRFIWGVYLTRHQLIKQAVRKNPQIKSLRIEVTGPQSLRISVKENALLGAAVMNNDTYAVLADGQLQRTKTADNGIAYKRFDGHKKALAATAAQLGKLKPAIRNGISSVSYQPTKEYPDRVIIYMRDGNTVYGDLNTIGDKMGYYPAIAASMKNKGIIDLQVGAYSYDYGSKDK
ncbi:cell division protein FtsQ/DivIB [Limosilactobacillus reuteri]|uniref:Cell division protein DivIB n=1 Tax=Limosilactobacillus reuteri TaxID=1598 RepID=A0A256VKP5_LIMRT|nr:FtsQ-type POTRA domain-containing protein [Limosilactobacillus reuteri]MCC4373699.1 FtsQ-type POTRA domain-containing protein [Limosilactobacillus reuteri]MCR1878629.1 FtsQ-type POTRA domain-containing protein [Limosilactobacillus reuteri]OYS58941.1 cell division protein FtsQ [Limosilactobacillus reuteri]OYS62879.1 cell division protein FtsQ [Limosilactobacillus reuteri]OYS64306.1 cell division protein FtsQ [Limosilactobacillus reuteri]